MSGRTPELGFERLLEALERELIGATDEEVLKAARELGMNPMMKGSSAFFGVTTPTLRDFRLDDPKTWSDPEPPSDPSRDDVQQ